mgnify:CR=1 FL=1
MNNLIATLYIASACGGALLLVHVILQASRDIHLNRTDPPWVIRQRKYAFYADIIWLILSACLVDYWLLNPTVITVAIYSIGMITCGSWILVINKISLELRKPPTNRSERDAVSPAHRLWRPLRAIAHRMVPHRSRPE